MFSRILGVDIDNPTLAPSGVSGISSGNLGTVPGTYKYKVTFVSQYGETEAGPESAVITNTNGSIDLNNIPICTQYEVLSRKIYRTMEGAAGLFLFVAAINNNITRTYTDITADGDLGSVEPESNFASTVGKIEGSVGFSRQILRSQSNVVAAGVDRLTATELERIEFVFVDSTPVGAGVRLPGINGSLIGTKITINNDDVANNLEIYPRSAIDSINGGPPGSAITLSAGFSIELISISAAEWKSASSLTAGVAGPPSGAAGGDLTGSFPTPSLATNGVTSGTYGSATEVPIVTVDDKGRVSTIAVATVSTLPTGAAGGDLIGSYPNPELSNTGVPPGTYGAGNQIPVVDVDGKGRITNITTTPLVVTTSGAAGGDLSGSYPNPELTATGVTSGTYGSTTEVPQFAVDSKGRVTAVTNLPLTAVPGGTASGDLVGVYPGPSLAPSGVAAGTYGDSGNVPSFTVDSKGRITTITTDPVSSGPPSGAAGGVLDGTYPSPSLVAVVAGGDYTKVTVGVDGRVMAGTILGAADIPNPTGDLSGSYAATTVVSMQGVNVYGSSANKLSVIGGTNNAGTSNTIHGVGAGVALTTGSNNTIMGADAGALVLGDDNTIIGNGAGSTLTNGSNNIILGDNANVSTATTSNEIAIGNASHTQVRFNGVGAIPIYANNAAAILGGLTPGCLYRTGADPDLLCIVH